MILIAIPTRIPSSSGRTRHDINAANPGTKSVFLLRHNGLITRTSIIKITAEMMIPASAALGM